MAATDIATARVTKSRPRNEIGPVARQRIRWGYFFLMPWFIGFLAFQLLPIVFTLFLSFTDYKANVEFAPGNFKFIGLNNYAHLFNDPDMLHSMGVTLKFVVIACQSDWPSR